MTAADDGSASAGRTRRTRSAELRAIRGESAEPHAPLSGDPAEEVELVGLLEALQRRWGIDLRGWAAAPLRAKLRARMHERGLATLSELQGWLLRDRPAVEALFAELWRKRAPALFHDAPFWRGLRGKVIPVLKSWPLVRVWVAGCGTGEDAWSMALLLEEEGLGARARIIATDPDERALEAARRGHDAVPAEALQRIVWSRHLPGVDGPMNEFSLVLFRHPFGWTGGAARRDIAALLFASQARFGFLCLDDVATLRALEGGAARASDERRWEIVDPELAIVRRVA